MTEQWQELKETITELRDNDGTGTQQEVCKFLANLMNVLEKQMSSSENPNKWIPVSERLSKDHENVLIYLSSNQITIGLYNSHRLPFMDKPIGWGADAPHDWSSDDVIAWMPLPESYKLQGSEDKE